MTQTKLVRQTKLSEKLCGEGGDRRISAYLQQVPSPGRQLGHDLRERHGGVVERELLELRQRVHVGPRVLGGRAQELEDALQLVVDVAAGEEGAAGVGQLCKQRGTSFPF